MRHRMPRARRGVILLVVISLLMLFAVAGIAFVIYSEAQATTGRIWREGESVRRPDMDPELLLSAFLGQLIYDTDNPHSALRGHSLARSLYGNPGSTIPFNGPGRRPTDPLDFTAYSGAGPDPNSLPSPNVPYTYPDRNNLSLGGAIHD